MIVLFFFLQRIEWDPRQYDKDYCLMRKKSEVSHGNDHNTQVITC